MVGMKTARSGRYPVALAIAGLAAFTYSRVAVAQAPEKKPNILVIFGDDIGQTNSAPTRSAWWATRRRTSIASPRKA